MILVLQDCDDVEALYITDKTLAEVREAFWEKYPYNLFVRFGDITYEYFICGPNYHTICVKDFEVGPVKKVNFLEVVPSSEIDWNVNKIPWAFKRKFRKFVHETCESVSFNHI